MKKMNRLGWWWKDEENEWGEAMGLGVDQGLDCEGEGGGRGGHVVSDDGGGNHGGE